MSEEIVDKVRKGIFDDIPRLKQRVRCEKCGGVENRYIDYLKSGEFEVAAPKRISVTQPGHYYLLVSEEETITQIYLRVKCRCGHENRVTDPILTVEYLRGYKRKTCLSYV